MRSLDDWLSYQQRVHARAVDMSLERVTEVARRLQVISGTARIATIGGTNGKGSTATTLASLLRACGQNVGLFTSPHLVRYNERIQIDGAPVSDAQLQSAFEQVEQARGDITLTFFEYSTLAALHLFRRASVDTMVLEVGLGGRLDATNILDADVAIVCSIGLDHREYLGETLELIGAEKAGIFRPGQRVVLGSRDMPASVTMRAQTLGCEVWLAERDFHWEHRSGGGPWGYRSRLGQLESLPAPSLSGEIQYRNAATALTALRLLALPADCNADTVARGLKQVRLSGRFQVVPGDIGWILDVAHNEPAAAVLAAALQAVPASGRTLAVAGMLIDKDVGAIARRLAPLIDQWVLVGISDDARGLTARALHERMGASPGSVELADDVPSGCARALALAQPGDRIVVLGSFHVVGPALMWLGLY
ncbi:MAG TPA: bifunctional tetrahydrofolate synthase/dihydrofolate synthase [Steroidobacteraceae bacterium]|nr:bifunctional tetrahydrofolate synthase/dihydrofolate synthase [Steroidobacteraceae bacterium]